MSEKKKVVRKKRVVKKKAPTPPVAKTTRRVRKKKPRPVKSESALLPYLRHQALGDYVTDLEGRDAKYHYLRLDRDYRTQVDMAVFLQWMREDEWADKRAAFWAEAEQQLLEKTREHTVQVLASSMNQAAELRDYVLEWCEPVRDPETKEVLRYPDYDDLGKVHPLAGKPILAVPVKSLEKAVASFLALDEAVRERRDEVLRLTGHGESASKPAEDPVAASLKLSPDDIRSLAAQMVKLRQPGLAEHTLDIEPEGKVDYDEPDEA